MRRGLCLQAKEEGLGKPSLWHLVLDLQLHACSCCNEVSCQGSRHPTQDKPWPVPHGTLAEPTCFASEVCLCRKKPAGWGPHCQHLSGRRLQIWGCNWIWGHVHGRGNEAKLTRRMSIQDTRPLFYYLWIGVLTRVCCAGRSNPGPTSQARTLFPVQIYDLKELVDLWER